jgi:hypothetical protein
MMASAGSPPYRPERRRHDASVGPPEAPDSDLVLSDADREFLDFLADAALELYFARRRGAK